jgi:hypothetical protein
MNVVLTLFPREKFTRPQYRAGSNGVSDELPDQKLDLHAEPMNSLFSSTEILHVVALEPFLCLFDLGI